MPQTITPVPLDTLSLMRYAQKVAVGDSMANVSSKIKEASGIKSKAFRCNLKTLRKQMGDTQSSFAGKVGLRDGHIGALESEAYQRVPNLQTAVVIAKTCGVTTEALLGVNWDLNRENMAALGCSQMQDVSTIVEKIKQKKIEQMKDGLHSHTISADYYEGALEAYQQILELFKKEDDE